VSYRPPMLIVIRPVLNMAVASLLLWDTRDPILLAKLMDSWHYRPLLTDREAEEVVRHVANQPL
jgi:hypothetical protein